MSLESLRAKYRTVERMLNNEDGRTCSRWWIVQRRDERGFWRDVAGKHKAEAAAEAEAARLDGRML